MHHLRGNQTRWEALLQQELAEETRTEISEAEELPEVELDTETEAEVDAGESRRASVLSLATGDRVSLSLVPRVVWLAVFQLESSYFETRNSSLELAKIFWKPYLFCSFNWFQIILKIKYLRTIILTNQLIVCQPSNI